MSLGLGSMKKKAAPKVIKHVGLFIVCTKAKFITTFGVFDGLKLFNHQNVHKSRQIHGISKQLDIYLCNHPLI